MADPLPLHNNTNDPQPLNNNMSLRFNDPVLLNLNDQLGEHFFSKEGINSNLDEYYRQGNPELPGERYLWNFMSKFPWPENGDNYSNNQTITFNKNDIKELRENNLLIQRNPNYSENLKNSITALLNEVNNLSGGKRKRKLRKTRKHKGSKYRKNRSLRH